MEPALPEGWQPVSSAFRRGDAGAVLRVGFRSPGGGAAQLVESNVMAGALVSAELGAGAHDEGTTNLDGRSGTGTWPPRATTRSSSASRTGR